MAVKNIPIVFFSTSRDDQEALSDLIDANAKCEFIGPIGDINTPMLVFKSKKFIGKNGIKLFISLYKNEK
ncbi:MAG: hypothetical protein ACFFAF_03320 [Candidatus Hermodarchaeota archaeon]